MSEPNVDGLTEYLAGGREVRLADWVWGLSRWGQRPLVLAAFGAAELCLEPWLQGVPEDKWWPGSSVRPPAAADGMEALRVWLRDASELARQQLLKSTEILSDQVGSADMYVIEASGGSGIIERRERCLWAGNAILSAFSAALWTELNVSSAYDDAEREARIAAGPALEAWRAVSGYQACHREAAETAIRALVQRAVLEPRL